MEDEMVEEEPEYIFTVHEIDLDYEFDAPRFFDFKHEESLGDARRAELWFHSAGSYPPSPFVDNLVSREEILLGNINISSKYKGAESMYFSQSDSDVGADNEIMEMSSDDEGKDEATSCSVHIDRQQQFQNRSQMSPSGLTFYNHMKNTVKSETRKPSIKPTFPRASTLMKPTASQLAKQNRPFQTGYYRSNLPVFEKASRSPDTGCVIENQTAKRQKLEGGLLRKVAGTVQLQQTNFVHKVSKRDILDGNPKQAKLRITVPRNQHLETACRAQRLNSTKDYKGTSAAGQFKALPLNRKILKAPSLLPKRSIPHQPDFQEFHLKTLERALQHGSAVLNSKVPSNHSDKDMHKCSTNLTRDCGNKVPVRPDTREPSQCFKALPLNKKILSCKGEIGIFRKIKKETTLTMEFNFQTEKRCHDKPPTELFNKLSLASEAQVPHSISTPMKRSQNGTVGVASSKGMR